MKKKNILVGLLLGVGMFSCIDIVPTNTYANNLHINILATNSEETFKITNVNLRKKIINLLGKDNNYVLSAEDFLNSPFYTANQETGKVERKCLDLSYSNITDISELSKFSLPDSLVAIDLSGNNITNENLEGIISYINNNTKILKVNLSFNHINLDGLGEILDDTRLIFGIQNLDFNSSHMYLYDEVKNAKYYIRSTDPIYMSFNFKFNSSVYTYSENQIKNVFTDLGEYEFNIANPPNSETGYFYGVDIHEMCKVFTANIKPTFSIERKSLFNLTEENIEISGILGNYSIVINNASTSTAGLQDVLVIITTGETTRNIILKFNVVDTTIPTITLTPSNTNIIYWRKNRSFVEPGYRGDDSGDDLTSLVNVDYSNLDVTNVGTYSIKYTLRDLSGLNAVEVVRTVVVQEQVLDEINLKTTTEKLEVGKEIVLTVQPHEDIAIDKYKDFVYTWYLNGEFFKTTSGDKVTGKSTTIITPDKPGKYDIQVKLHAKQKIDNADVYVDSQTMELNVELVDSNTTLIIAMVVAIGIVMTVFVSSNIIKARKRNKLAKKSGKNSTQKDSNIQVIKNYNNDKDNK